MTPYDPTGQQNPEEAEPFGAPASRVESTVKTLEANKAVVGRWFWKGLLALNLVTWSLALPVFVLVRFG